MAQTPNSFPPRVLQLMKRIETETDRETLMQLFEELNLLANANERRMQPSKKTVLRHWLRTKRRRKVST